MNIRLSSSFILILFSFIVCSLFPKNLQAQTLPVGDFREEQVRIQQLFNDSLSISFSNRPVWKKTYDAFLPESTEDKSLWKQPYDFLQKTFFEGNESYDNITLGIYEPFIKNTYNTKFPYGENNGAAWYGRGLTTEFQGGGFLTSDYVTLTFRPHLIYSENQDFRVPRFVPRDQDGNVLYGHKELGFGIDEPFRFGPDSYTDFNLGQTSARIHYKNIEAGLSNETLWWGPGVRYALILSNNAPGLKHVFLGTRGPISIPLGIGKFEFKLIGAWPEDSQYFRTTEETNRQRFMSGFNFNFSPSVAPNLHLGFTRAVHSYVPEGGLGASDFWGAANFFERQTPQSAGGTGNDEKNSLVSVYLRWVFPESHAEIYGEYFREDSFESSRDLFLEPDHDRAYTLGFQKIIESNWIDFFKVNLELNSLLPNRTDEVKRQTYYYTHGQIRQGHTNGGQILGAAIGPGSESQFLSVDGFFSRGKLGIILQRVVDNNYFHYEFNERFVFPNVSGNKDYFNHRVDLNLGLNGAYKVGPVLLRGKVIYNKKFNYGRYDLGRNFAPDDNFAENDLVNWNFSLSARYLF
jgi:hypothetical protein